MNRVAVFKELNHDQMELLSPLFEDFSCLPGTIIFRQGERAQFLYMILTGKVDMSFKPYDGIPITVSHVGKDGFFGWSAVVGSEKYTSTAIAIEPVKGFRIRGSDLRKFCQQYPEEGTDILERLADGVSLRWKDAHKQVQAILVQGMIKRSSVV